VVPAAWHSDRKPSRAEIWIIGPRTPSQGSDVEQSPAVNGLYFSIGFVVVDCSTDPLTNNLSGMLWLAFVLLSVAVVMFWLSARQRRLAGLPGGRVIYVDTSQWAKVEKPLYDRVLNLTGKPDYLVQSGDTYLPVEIKSSQVHQRPYESHIYQLAAYCLLVERTYGYRPTYGILHYTNRTFAVDYTPQLERALLELLAEIRSSQASQDVNRSHNARQRCISCGYRSVCDQALN
jgi:CRISPR-associated exonuclease Cas4